MIINQRNKQILAPETFKAKNKLLPEIITEVFNFIEKHCNLLNPISMQRRANQTVDFYTELASLAPKSLGSYCFGC